MKRYANLPDVLLIFLSAYAVVWAINGALRHVGANDLQA